MPFKDYPLSVCKSLKSANQVLVPRTLGRPRKKALQLSVPKRKHAMASDDARYNKLSHWPVAAYNVPLVFRRTKETRQEVASPMGRKGVYGFKCAK